MQKIIEICGFHFSFTLDGIGFRDESFQIEQFNYGSGTYYQKFKNKVPVELHDDLKAMKDVDVSVMDGLGENFMFVTNTSNEDEAHEQAKRVLRICKSIHNYTQTVEISIVKRVLVEELNKVIVA